MGLRTISVIEAGKFSSLQILDLSYNLLGSFLVTKIFNGLQLMPQLMHLVLIKVGFREVKKKARSSLGRKPSSSDVSSPIQDKSNIIGVNLMRNQLSSFHCISDQLVKYQKITLLSLASCQIPLYKQIDRLLSTVINFKNLEILSLTGNNIGNQRGSELIVTLWKKNIKELLLQDTKIGDNVLNSISSCRNKFESLQILFLSHNLFTYSAWHSFFKKVSQFKNLQSLMINRNNLGPKAMDFDQKKIEQAAKKLKTIDIRDVGAKPASVKMFFEISMKANPNLKLLIQQQQQKKQQQQAQGRPV